MRSARPLDFFIFAIAASLLALAGCSSSSSPADGGNPGDGGSTDGGAGPHPTPGPGQSAAWQIESEADLIPGPATHGRVGDWMIANGRVRFIIEGAHASDGYDPYGGNILAADRQRADGGESRWGEAFIGLNFRAPGCDTVQLVDDGTGGDAAELLATGSDEVSPFMASVFAPGFEPAPLNATITRDYSLPPDSDALLLTFTVQNNGDAPLELKEPYLALAMSRGLAHWLPESGFNVTSIAALNPSAEFYAAVGEKVSYSILELSAPFSPIIDFAKVLMGQYPQVTIPAGQAFAYRFAIAVGTGDVGSLQAAHAEVRGALSQAVSLTGTVVDPAGAPVAGARVHVAPTSSLGTEVSFARTAADGSFLVPIPPGDYTLSAIDDSHVFTTAQNVTLPQTGLSGVQLTLGGSAQLAVTAVDAASGQPMPVKIVAEPASDSARHTFPDSYGEPAALDPVVSFSASGQATLALYPGDWKVTVSRGFEYDIAVENLTVAPGATGVVNASLHRVVNTTGWQSGDFHIHAQDSPDSDDLRPLKVTAFAAEGVEIPVQTDHEWVGDFSPTVAALGLGSFMHPVAGTELTTTFIGHFNVFPLAPDTTQLNQGAFNWYNRLIPDVIAEARSRVQPGGLVPFVQMNHPRTTGMAYLSSVNFDPSLFAASGDLAQHYMTNWDAMEIWNGFPLVQFDGCPPGSTSATCSVPFPLQNDWFAFLSHGIHVTGTGNSDSHIASTNAVGYPRNFVNVGGDDPSALTDAQLLAALRAGHSTISGGPFLVITSTNASGATVGMGDTASTQTLDGQSVLPLHIDVQAPTWMGPLSRVDLWIGSAADPQQPGVLALSLDLTQPPYLDDGTQVQRVSTTVNVPIATDTWVVATVRGPVDANGNSNALWPVVETTVPPFAVSNPIWVDADGDGVSSPVIPP